MHTCSPLYASFALESFANTCLGLFFVYLSMLITSKSKLKTPARDTVLFLYDCVYARYVDVMSIVRQWPMMKDAKLEKRFRWCRKVNATICQFSALVSFLAITRWLHINNVNGFRYLGYAFTCPPMQAELLVLIAPVVPCYRFMVTMTILVTFAMLITGWIASCVHGEMWTGPDLYDWYNSGMEEDLKLTFKGWMFVASCGCELLLLFIELPFALFLYFINGGPKAGLPEGYPRVIALVWVTWWLFPLWWCVSFEGFELITDTKMNGVGFTLLNLVSKGGFTLSILRMVRKHKEKGIIPRNSQESIDVKGYMQAAEKAQAQDGGDSRRMTPLATHLSGDAWFTSILARYEPGNSGPTTNAYGSGTEKTDQGGSSHPVGPADATQLSTEVLMQEVMRRVMTGDMQVVPASASEAPTAAPNNSAKEPSSGRTGTPPTIGEEDEDDEEVAEKPKLMNF